MGLNQAILSQKLPRQIQPTAIRQSAVWLLMVCCAVTRLALALLLVCGASASVCTLVHNNQTYELRADALHCVALQGAGSLQVHANDWQATVFSDAFCSEGFPMNGAGRPPNISIVCPHPIADMSVHLPAPWSGVSNHEREGLKPIANLRRSLTSRAEKNRRSIVGNFTVFVSALLNYSQSPCGETPATACRSIALSVDSVYQMADPVPASVTVTIAVAGGTYTAECGNIPTINFNVVIAGTANATFINCVMPLYNWTLFSITSAYASLANISISEGDQGSFPLLFNCAHSFCDVRLTAMNFTEAVTAASFNFPTSGSLIVTNSIFSSLVSATVINFGNNASTTTNSSTVIFRSCQFHNNAALINGGAFAITYQSPTFNSLVHISQSGFVGNTVLNDVSQQYYCQGGAVAIMYNASATNSTVIIDQGSVFNDNTIQIGTSNFNYGGAVSVYYNYSAIGCNVFVNDTIFNSNGNGGGLNFGGGLSVYYNGLASGCTATVSNSNFIGNYNTNQNNNNPNQALSNYGGAVSVFVGLVGSKPNSVVITHSQFVNNINSNYNHNLYNLYNYGGAISLNILQSGTTLATTALLSDVLFVSGCSFQGNANDNGNNNVYSAQQATVNENYGGAIAVRISSSNSFMGVTISDCNFGRNNNFNNNNNINSNQGGAIFVDVGGAYSWNFLLNISNLICTSSTNTNYNSLYLSVSGEDYVNAGGCIAARFFASNLSNANVAITGGTYSNNGNINYNSNNVNNYNYGGAVAILFPVSGYGTTCLVANAVNINVSNAIFTGNSNVNDNNNGNFNNDYNFNMGGALSVHSVTLNTVAPAIYVLNCEFVSNSNMNSDCTSFNYNYGGAVSLQFAGTSMSAGVVDIAGTYYGNSNTNNNNVDNNFNIGGSVSVSLMAAQTAYCNTMINALIANSLNKNTQNDNGNYNWGGGVAVNFSDCSDCQLNSNSLNISNSVNDQAANHFQSQNYGGALSVYVGPDSLNCQMFIESSLFAANQNSISLGSQNIGNFGAAFGLYFANVNSSWVEIYGSTFVNNLNAPLLGDGTNSGALIAYNFTSPTADLYIFHNTFSYTEGFPGGLLNSLSPDTLCSGAAGTTDSRVSANNNRCALQCKAGFNLAGFACTPAALSSSVSIGVCTAYAIGIVLGVLAVGVAVFFWLRWLYRRTRNRYELEQLTLREHLLENDQQRNLLLQEVNTLKKAWEIEWEDIQLGKEIGKGAFGTVYAGTWRDLKVAIKVVGTVIYSAAGEAVTNPMFSTAEMDKEVSMLQTVRHPNIVLFFGAGKCQDGSTFLVTELIERGTLTQVLKHAKYPWAQKASFALDTCRGMAHVHGLGRMHRDLKSGNLLVSAAMRVKVADFGTATLATLSHEAHESSAPAIDSTTMVNPLLSVGMRHRTKGVGTPLWMAPEIIQCRPYGPGADMYSFGIVMWEIAAQAYPWSDIETTPFFMSALGTRILAGDRPPCQPDWPADYVRAMQQCWATQPEERPSFADVCPVLAAIAEQP